MAVNLALSLASLPDCRTVLIDLDLRRPQVSALLGANTARPTNAFLEGKADAAQAFVRYRENLAISAGSKEVPLSAELLQSQSAHKAMAELKYCLRPDVILIDLPPALGSDDVLAFLPNVDCAMIVIAAGSTTPSEVDLCERELARQTKLLGVVLNKCRHQQRAGYY